MLHSFATTDDQEENYGFVEDSSRFNLDTYTTILSHELTEAKTDTSVEQLRCRAHRGDWHRGDRGRNFPLAAETTNPGEISDFEGGENDTYRLGGPGGLLSSRTGPRTTTRS